TIRTVSVILAATLWNIERYFAIVALVAGAILPYIAVVIANAGRERPPSLPSTFVTAPTRTMIMPPRAREEGARADSAARDVPPEPPTGGLPRRVRQASLARQLREDSAERTVQRAPVDTFDDGERDADEVRNRMASLQRGWQRGRRENAGTTEDTANTGTTGNTASTTTTESAEDTVNTGDPGGTAPGTTPGGDGR
ncbi:DUF3099 domain-containing protein, partial [Streptomyces rubiginosohelvolus]|uniref:DUF3099 domain-containing protein n=1 Tax=Streptomyces rubiginosohelvolus TaxID=67362 RepID=UPI0033F0E7AB